MRKHGLTVDQLTSSMSSPPTGEFVRASEEENTDLFWGMRGGGGNFGIVTEFEFRLVPLGPIVLAGPIFWAMEDSPEVLRFYRDWIADAPDELTTIVFHRKAPPLPFVPSELHGKPVVLVILCYRDRSRTGRTSSADAGVRLTGRRPLHPEVVPRAPVDVRSGVPRRALVLLQELRRRRAQRRDDRHHRRALPEYPVAADLVPDLADGRRCLPGGRR